MPHEQVELQQCLSNRDRIFSTFRITRILALEAAGALSMIPFGECHMTLMLVHHALCMEATQPLECSSDQFLDAGLRAWRIYSSLQSVDAYSAGEGHQGVCIARNLRQVHMRSCLPCLLTARTSLT